MVLLEYTSVQSVGVVPRAIEYGGRRFEYNSVPLYCL